ncbi:hypothetical protein QUB17_33805 [Microcoleus sp. B5-C4]|uniref:hypothetical protein n=1 Tax=unclassified Microcoleus TaxID=2642155 RepID=UPI002FCE8A09
MSRVDMFVLAVLSRKNYLSLSSVVKEVREMNLSKPPSKIGIYKRLNVLKNQNLVSFEWNQGKKIYFISEKGCEIINEFINQLIGISA